MTITGIINGLVVLIDGEHQHPDETSQEVIPVPLTGVEVNSRVVNFTAQVDIIQTYVNTEKTPIEAIYFFPVEEEAVVTEFIAEVEGRVVRAVVKEKEIARKDYQAAIKNRKTAVLLEETTPDVFQVNIGHLGPGASCKVSITYITELPVEGGKTRLTIPTTVAPRYVPTKDTSSRATSISSIEHSDKSPAKLKLSLEIFMKTRIESVESPTHRINIIGEDQMDQHGYFLSQTEFSATTSIMDRDIVILIDSQEPNKPKVWIEKGDENTKVAMVSFVPEFKLQDHTAEMIFLVDCSGSMNGRSMEMAREALQLFLHSLPVNCYFNIFRFGSKHRSLFERSQLYDDNSLSRAKNYAADMSADLGGTEILNPLNEIFRQNVIKGTSRQVIILTDGDVSNSSDCIEAVRDNADSCRVFSLGIGPSASRHLVKGMARAGNGTAVFATYGENLGPKVLMQLRQALQPCIRDIKVKWGIDESDKEMSRPVMENTKTLLGRREGQSRFNKEKSTSGKQAPSEIPAIYDGHRLLVYNMYTENEVIPRSFEITAETPEGPLHLKISVDKESYLEGKMIHQMYARKLIQDLEESFRCRENQEDCRQMVVDLGVKYGIASRFTSFIGVDDKQGREVGVMLTRQVKNQIPTGFGGMRAIQQSSSGEEEESFHRNAPGLVPMGRSLRGPTKLEATPQISLSASRMSNLLELMNLQLAEGMFRKDEIILKKYIGERINATIQNAALQHVTEDVWIIAIVVAIIEKKFFAVRDNWMMSVEKAKQWIRSQGAVPEDIIKKAKIFQDYI